MIERPTHFVNGLSLCISSVFCCSLRKLFKSQRKNKPFLCIPIFDNF